MKGGVGKTTLAFNLACYSAQVALGRLRVLAVDLDPQANLSQCLLGEARYLEHINNFRPTTAELFDGMMPPSEAAAAATPVEPSDLIVRLNPWANWRLDLVPSRLELAHALRDPSGKEGVLARFLAVTAPEYDLVIVDCAPTESVLTTAAYQASRYVVVPVQPEFLATVGFPMLARSLDEFRAGHANQAIDIAGIVFNGGQRTDAPRQERASMRDIRRIAEENGWYVLKQAVHESRSFPNGSRVARPIFSTKYARRDVKDEFKRVAEELLERMGLGFAERIKSRRPR